MSDTPTEHDGKSLFAVPDTVISGELQMTEYGKRLLASCGRVPDAGYAEYTDGSGVKYAGTLYRVVPKEQNQEQNQDIIYGDLGDHAAVWHDESWGHDQIAIRAKGEVRVHLDPGQFLRLLDWGITHRAAIEQLAKEQQP